MWHHIPADSDLNPSCITNIYQNARLLFLFFTAETSNTVVNFSCISVQHSKTATRANTSENVENVILKIMMGTDNEIYWHIFQHTFKPQQQDVPSAYNMYISHVFYGVLNASLSLDCLYFLCKSVTSQIFLILYCHHIELYSVNSMITKFDIWHPGLSSALTHRYL